MAKRRASRYLVGIDLGTTHTVVAYADTRARDAARRAVQIFPVRQWVAIGAQAERALLPSLRYHPADGELPDSIPTLSRQASAESRIPDGVIGELARELGAKTPGRLVTSAKSWLSHSAVDRSAAILPWGAPEEVPKISPLAANASYLAHLRTAWNQQFSDYPLETQDVVLTLPASFDEDARALTVEAARLAGLDPLHLHLLEEPQAACYDWLYRQGEQLSDALAGTRLLLVCDIGGGTTDLTLIRVERGAQGPRLTRIGVGDHLMLGGDNMDLALAQRVEKQFGGGKPLRAAELAQLMQQCRSAKERLLEANAPARASVTLLGSGSRLIGGARTGELRREEVAELVLDGFFPKVSLAARPSSRRGAIIEFGLPYVADPAISRHLAAFLARFADDGKLPDTVLLNGGVFHSPRLAERLLAILADWHGTGAFLRLLDNPAPDLAVARGAVAYGLARRGKGLKIGGGAARSYFLLVEGDAGQQRQGVCLLPRGSEEGREVRLQKQQFSLRLGQPVRFHLASRSDAKRYRPGDLALIESGDEDFVQLPPIATVLESEAAAQRDVPVQLACALTEVGTLALHCVANDASGRRWGLEFQLRGGVEVLIEDKLHPHFGEAADAIRQYYGDRSKAVNPKAVKTLRSDLEKLLGKRDAWDSALLRELYAVLLEGAKRRRRSPDHERLWFNLSGFCLRPGFGYPLDDWRIEQLWPLYEQGVQYAKEPQNRSEWWTLWRRVAGGLAGDAQAAILDDIAAQLQPAKRRSAKALTQDDVVRLVAALEHLTPAQKSEVGAWLLQRLQSKTESIQTWWAIGRLGARLPFYGSAHNVVAAEVAAEWLQQALKQDWKKVQPAAFAATLLARMSGDRERDLALDLRCRVIERLRAAKLPESWIRMVSEVTALDEADEKRVFGEALPPGLKLVK